MKIIYIYISIKYSCAWVQK